MARGGRLIQASGGRWLSDADIRPWLTRVLRREHRHNPGTVILEELGLQRGQVRIDLAVVNGVLHGYEIKSERDSLRRLGRQLKVYSQVLDFATIVVAPRHLKKTLSDIPAWWGVSVVATI